MTDLKELYHRTAADITERLVDEVSRVFNDVPELLKPCLHLITAGGKRVRAIIPMAFCGAVGADPKIATQVGMVMELVHTFTLIHDDIMDRSDHRRGVSAVHKIWGIPTAINTGNALFALALEMMQRGSMPPAIRSMGTRMLVKAGLDLARGQQMDLRAKERRGSTWQDYMRINELKTAPLFSAAAGLGVLAGNGSLEQIAHAEQWGTCFGISFQVRDDALDEDPPPIWDMIHSFEEEAAMWKKSALDSLEHFPEGKWRASLEALTNWQVTRSE